MIRQNHRAHSTRPATVSRSGYAEPMVALIIRVARLLIVLASRPRSLILEPGCDSSWLFYRRTRIAHGALVRSAVLGRAASHAAGLEIGPVVVRPATVVAWHRRGFAWLTCRSRPRGGRPQTRRDPTASQGDGVANPLWGAPRIHGELLKLGFEVSERTVSRLMPRRQKPPSQSWRTFLTNHLDSTVAVDFFAVPTLTRRILFVFVVLAHDRRRILHVNVTRHPTSVCCQ